MIEKVYVAEDKTAVFVCPECGKKRTMNLLSLHFAPGKIEF